LGRVWRDLRAGDSGVSQAADKLAACNDDCGLGSRTVQRGTRETPGGTAWRRCNRDGCDEARQARQGRARAADIPINGGELLGRLWHGRRMGWMGRVRAGRDGDHAGRDAWSRGRGRDVCVCGVGGDRSGTDMGSDDSGSRMDGWVDGWMGVDVVVVVFCRARWGGRTGGSSWDGLV
jgi:hypothetical protein